ncbi:hypothetical protein RJ640_012593 [Escallonia rubra]|uniref:FAD/NAD(P)-binding domain-containing protein n=1 Tax=Escallonia rubra TaxID=112253 RepID=A0AA88UEV5_9ASTE|nr:hypothetical protein RJ640_012593 [Escallonia rubra]
MASSDICKTELSSLVFEILTDEMEDFTGRSRKRHNSKTGTNLGVHEYTEMHFVLILTLAYIHQSPFAGICDMLALLNFNVASGECFRVVNNPNVTLHFNTETLDIVSNTKGQMSGILIRKVDTGEESVLDAKGLFYAIGHTPNSQLLEGQVDLDDSGYVLVEEGTAKTSVAGVFAAGDVQGRGVIKGQSSCTVGAALASKPPALFLRARHDTVSPPSPS